MFRREPLLPTSAASSSGASFGGGFTSSSSSSSSSSSLLSLVESLVARVPAMLRQSLETPRGRRNALMALVIAALLVLGLWQWADISALSSTSSSSSSSPSSSSSSSLASSPRRVEPLSRYLSQQSKLKLDEHSTEYHIAIISDMDKASKVNDREWRAILKRATLRRDPSTRRYSIVSWGEDEIFRSSFNEAGRAMELSELHYFNGRLLAFDDRSGLVMSLENGKAVPLHILMNGDGATDKGFKIEWCTVKDDVLFVGSIGKEWTNGGGAEGDVLNVDPQFVKTIDKEGRIKHHDWRHVYEKIREVTGTKFPGYIMHEAVNWHPLRRRWYFLPRRASKLPYDDVADEERATNILVSCDEEFGDWQVSTVGRLDKRLGFSSFKFVPWREDEAIALKTEEYRDTIRSFILVFDVLTGELLMDETPVGDVKFEGVEFV